MFICTTNILVIYVTALTLDDASKKYKYDWGMDATLHVSHQPSREATALLVLRR